ncbi:MAG: cytochrome C biogenesis protein CcmH [Robiginitomaculum sp.]|nr:MAG: cytochrome C biogenesis protein CcmH [Robiginitomaculum sp.]
MRALLILITALMLGAFITPELPLNDPSQEARALNLFKELRCPTCIAQSIHDSNADIAGDLRVIVREQIAQGRTNQEIRDYLVARYGDVILLRPPMNGATLPLWLGPWLIFLVGGGIVFVAMRRHRVKSD